MIRAAFLFFTILLLGRGCTGEEDNRTTVTIEGAEIFINGSPTLEGISYQGFSMQGLLPNSRMVQGIFDDLNPETADRWKYPDTGAWDPERNTDEFVAAMESWRNHGLLGFTINLQGGSPYGYSAKQPWHNSAVDSLGNLRPDYMARLKKILDRADALEMVPIVGIFYFGQDERLVDDDAVKNAVKNTLEWLHREGYRNVMIEIANECNNRKFDRDIIKADRVHELITYAQNLQDGEHAFPISVSYNGNTLPGDKVIGIADYILIHGNGVNDPARLTEMVEQVRNSPAYTPKPIIFNEDDHYRFDSTANNMLSAFKAGASWGFFDFRRMDEPFEAGYQSVPVDWKISHPRKAAFFGKLKEITAGE